MTTSSPEEAKTENNNDNNSSRIDGDNALLRTQSLDEKTKEEFNTDTSSNPLTMHKARSMDDLDFQSSEEKNNQRQEKFASNKAQSMDADDSGSVSSVSFGSVRVREYERVIDSTNIYMGLALGWNYKEAGPAPLKKEKNKVTSKSKQQQQQQQHHGGGEESRMKRTNGSDRYGMLLRYGYAQRELKQATREAGQFYKQRQKEAERDAARSIVLQDNRKSSAVDHHGNASAKQQRQQRRPLLRSMFG